MLNNTNANPHFDGRINVQFEQDIQTGSAVAVRLTKARGIYAANVRATAFVRLRERLRVYRWPGFPGPGDSNCATDDARVQGHKHGNGKTGSPELPV